MRLRIGIKETLLEFGWVDRLSGGKVLLDYCSCFGLDLRDYGVMNLTFFNI
jgi:hypothetical protein